MDVLRDKIPIRDAFTQADGHKYLLQLKNDAVTCDLMQTGFPDEYLPTEGEFMEAEEGEFDEDEAYYRGKARRKAGKK